MNRPPARHADSAGGRDRRFVAAHRGGPLSPRRHRQLMAWGRACARRVLRLAGRKPDARVTAALRVALAWERGRAATGEAMRAAVAAHAAARAATHPAAVAAARAAGQAVAAAHMADHALGAAWYALRAVSAAGRSQAAERRWQDAQLTPGIRRLVRSARRARGI